MRYARATREEYDAIIMAWAADLALPARCPPLIMQRLALAARAPLVVWNVGGCMKYVCDAPGGTTWFRIETEAEAANESDSMRHAVEKFFRKEQEKAIQ